MVSFRHLLLHCALRLLFVVRTVQSLQVEAAIVVGILGAHEGQILKNCHADARLVSLVSLSLRFSVGVGNLPFGSQMALTCVAAHLFKDLVVL